MLFFSLKSFITILYLVFKCDFLVFSLYKYIRIFKSNIYFRKIGLTKKVSNSIFLKSFDFSFINFLIQELRFWKFPLQYFLKCTLFHSFFSINKFRLKNIFLRVLNDSNIWYEINKMIDFGLISFFGKDVHKSFCYEDINSLSYFFFNVFLSEFDFYIFSFTVYLIFSYFKVYLYFYLFIYKVFLF